MIRDFYKVSLLGSIFTTRGERKVVIKCLFPSDIGELDEREEDL